MVSLAAPSPFVLVCSFAVAMRPLRVPVMPLCLVHPALSKAGVACLVLGLPRSRRLSSTPSNRPTCLRSRPPVPSHAAACLTKRTPAWDSSTPSTRQDAAIGEKDEADNDAGRGVDGDGEGRGRSCSWEREEVDAETYGKLHQIKHVLERWEISGFNRKLQLKPQRWETVADGEDHDDDDDVSIPEDRDGTGESEGRGGGGIASDTASEKATSAPASRSSRSRERTTQLLLILKWGGELTKLGQRQAIELGNSFRTIMYPDSSGGGVLRLHRCRRCRAHR